jgi:hypothetical protein
LGCLFLTLSFTPVLAASETMNTIVTNSHKFHVSTAVIFIILTGLIGFMIYLEVKMRGIEKKIK